MAESAEHLFGQRVAALREQRGLTQRELARLAGTAQVTIYRIEKGIVKAPSIELAARIARALGGDMNWLVGIYDLRDLEAAGLAVVETQHQTGNTQTLPVAEETPAV